MLLTESVGASDKSVYALISLPHEASCFCTSFSDILTFSPFCNPGWPQLQLLWWILPSHICCFMHKAFVHGTHRVSDFSGFATGWDEGTENEKVKPVFVGVVSMVCWFCNEWHMLGSELVDGVGNELCWVRVLSSWAWMDWNAGFSLIGCKLIWASNAAILRHAKSIQDVSSV